MFWSPGPQPCFVRENLWQFDFFFKSTIKKSFLNFSCINSSSTHRDVNENLQVVPYVIHWAFLWNSKSDLTQRMTLKWLLLCHITSVICYFSNLECPVAIFQVFLANAKWSAYNYYLVFLAKGHECLCAITLIDSDTIV